MFQLCARVRASIFVAVRGLGCISALALCLTLCLALGACNTIEGAGRDLQSGGKLLQDAARGTSDALAGE